MEQSESPPNKKATFLELVWKIPVTRWVIKTAPITPHTVQSYPQNKFHSKKTIELGLSCSGIGAHGRRCIIDSYMLSLWHCPPYVLEQDTWRLIKIGQTHFTASALCVCLDSEKRPWQGRRNITFILNTLKEPPIKACGYNINEVTSAASKRASRGFQMENLWKVKK